MLTRFFVATVAALALTGASAKPKYDVMRLESTVAMHKQDASYPQAEIVKGEKHFKDFEKLVDIAKDFGVRVVVGDDMDDLGLYGLYIQPKHIIFLNPDLSTDGAVEVLLHEESHMLTPMLGPEDEDIVAQGVAYIVAGNLGIDDTDATLYYYFWLTKSFDKALTKVMQNAKDITRVSQFLLAELNK